MTRKVQLRRVVFHRLKQQKEEDRRRKSEAIRRKVMRLSIYRRAKTVLCYVSLPYEVDTWRLIHMMLRQGKRLAVPVVKRRPRTLIAAEVRDPARELVPGPFGVLEPRPGRLRPIPLDAIDLAVVPGLAFDRRGRRLGHGHGYFDRLLARLPRTTPTVGVCFRLQLVDHLPHRPHDQAVQRVVTA